MKHLGLFIFGTFVTIWNGFAVRLAWNWLISPIFHVMTLTTVHAIIMCMMIEYLFYPYRKEEFTEDRYIHAIVMPGLLIVASYLLSFLI